MDFLTALILLTHVSKSLQKDILIQILLGCLATWCPCILYGKTQARLDHNHDPSFCNGSVRILF